VDIDYWSSVGKLVERYKKDDEIRIQPVIDLKYLSSAQNMHQKLFHFWLRNYMQKRRESAKFLVINILTQELSMR